MKYKYKCLYELTGKIEDVATFLVPITDLPPQRKPLTDEQMLKAFNSCEKVIDGLHAVAELAAHGIKE